jgi:hypothetical protein
MSPNHCRATMISNHDLRSFLLCDPRSHCFTTMSSNCGVDSFGQTDGMKDRHYQPTRCSSLSLGREEHLIMNWKGCEGKRSWPSSRQYPNTCLERLRKPHELQLGYRVSGARSEAGTFRTGNQSANHSAAKFCFRIMYI